MKKYRHRKPKRIYTSSRDTALFYINCKANSNCKFDIIVGQNMLFRILSKSLIKRKTRVAITIISVIMGAVAMPRFWCRYFCPMGAFSSFFNKVSIFSIRKEQLKCTKCNYCVSACPTRVQRVKDEDLDDRVTDMNCIFCLDCIEACPEKALSLSVNNKPIYRGGKGWWERRRLKP